MAQIYFCRYNNYVICNSIELTMNHMATIGKSGRLVIPIQYRRALGLTEGEGVMISLKDGHIEILPVEKSIKKAQEKVTKYLRSDTDLVEVLFAERKAEVANEQ